MSIFRNTSPRESRPQPEPAEPYGSGAGVVIKRAGESKATYGEEPVLLDIGKHSDELLAESLLARIGNGLAPVSSDFGADVLEKKLGGLRDASAAKQVEVAKSAEHVDTVAAEHDGYRSSLSKASAEKSDHERARADHSLAGREDDALAAHRRAELSSIREDALRRAIVECEGRLAQARDDHQAAKVAADEAANAVHAAEFSIRNNRGIAQFPRRLDVVERALEILDDEIYALRRDSLIWGQHPGGQHLHRRVRELAQRHAARVAAKRRVAVAQVGGAWPSINIG